MVAVAGALGGCNTTSSSSKQYGVTASPRIVSYGKPIPEGGGYYKVGSPYKVAGRWYHPKEDVGYDEVGLASWYGSDFHGRRTANGEVFDMADLSAAHPTLPLPTYARVTNLENGRSVVVRVNDRGPFAHNRLIDVSKRTADVLDFRGNGTAKVRVQYVGIAPLEGNDGQWLTTTVRNSGEPVGPVMMASNTPPQTQQMVQTPQAPTRQVAQAQSAGWTQQSAQVSRTVASLETPPPAPPPGTPAPPGATISYPQQTTAYTPAAGKAIGTPTTVPVQAAYSESFNGPTPKVPVEAGAPASSGAGKVVYRWVSGYAPDEGNVLVANAFSAFATDGNSLVDIVQRPDGGGGDRFYR